MSTNRLLARGFAVAIAAGAVVLAGGGVASAHVTANVTEPAKQGGYSKITFRVPNEDASQGTIKLQLVFPKDTPLTGARPKPVPGWTAEVKKTQLDKPVSNGHGGEIKEAIDTITWTAQPGTRINPGEFQEFDISAGPLPKADQLIIPAIQTYDGAKGEVKWDAPPTAGEEPEHPAPVVKLVAAAAGEDAHGSAGTQSDVKPAADSHNEAAAAGTDTTARWLGGIGLVVGALGLGLGIGATLRAKRVTAAARGGEKA
ncbi:YcnI family protein [Kibdelosporangium philippinense]|uniref:YcnI family protein n=1 Tax=Kibdelosporangium philippinense TaxID=211113 RepID=A0ABS8ZCU3_9PSEU|nr:YcnI family protein [Kibdelosporangium philippinense]MCE7005034.1 YcnI family protein [Kibdelosporangium philippinense]